jgi:Cys-rich protein (TIGR01571 family)
MLLSFVLFASVTATDNFGVSEEAPKPEGSQPSASSPRDPFEEKLDPERERFHRRERPGEKCPKVVSEWLGPAMVAQIFFCVLAVRCCACGIGVWECTSWSKQMEERFSANSRLPVSEIARDLEFGAMVGQPLDQQCDCFTDMESCLCAFCCFHLFLAQIYEKLLGPKGSCRVLTIIFCTLTFFGQTLPGASEALASEKGFCISHVFLAPLVWDLLGIISIAVTFRIVLVYRGRYAINRGSFFGMLLETVFCLHCTVAQISRHVYMYRRRGARACNCSATGDSGQEYWLWDKGSWPAEVQQDEQQLREVHGSNIAHAPGISLASQEHVA